MALLSPSRQVFFIALLAVVILDSYLLLHNVSLADCSLFNTHSLQSLTNGGEASLAARQSYGFFDDIQDVDWRRMQKRAQMTATWKTKTMPTKNTQDDDTVVSYLNRLQVSTLKTTLMDSTHSKTMLTLIHHILFCSAGIHMPVGHSSCRWRPRSSVDLRPASFAKEKVVLDLLHCY